MIVGSGLMARTFARFSQARDILIFASGVSNSLARDAVQFDRERRLLERVRSEHRPALLVYFSSCSIYDPDRIDTPYVRHKLEMESLLAAMGGDYLILRLPLVIGHSDHATTLPHVLCSRILSGEPFEVWTRAVRYPIDADDVARIAERLLCNPSLKRCRINLALRSYRVMDFVNAMEQVLGRRANVQLVDKGSPFRLSCPEVQSLASELALDYSEAYLPRVLHKYFHAFAPGERVTDDRPQRSFGSA